MWWKLFTLEPRLIVFVQSFVHCGIWHLTFVLFVARKIPLLHVNVYLSKVTDNFLKNSTPWWPEKCKNLSCEKIWRVFVMYFWRNRWHRNKTFIFINTSTFYPSLMTVLEIHYNYHYFLEFLNTLPTWNTDVYKSTYPYNLFEFYSQNI